MANTACLLLTLKRISENCQAIYRAA